MGPVVEPIRRFLFRQSNQQQRPGQPESDGQPVDAVGERAQPVGEVVAHLADAVHGTEPGASETGRVPGEAPWRVGAVEGREVLVAPLDPPATHTVQVAVLESQSLQQVRGEAVAQVLDASWPLLTLAVSPAPALLSLPRWLSLSTPSR